MQFKKVDVSKIDYTRGYRQLGYGFTGQVINDTWNAILSTRSPVAVSDNLVYLSLPMPIKPGDSGSPIYIEVRSDIIGIVSSVPKNGSCRVFVSPFTNDTIDLMERADAWSL